MKRSFLSKSLAFILSITLSVSGAATLNVNAAAQDTNDAAVISSEAGSEQDVSQPGDSDQNIDNAGNQTENAGSGAETSESDNSAEAGSELGEPSSDANEVEGGEAIDNSDATDISDSKESSEEENTDDTENTENSDNTENADNADSSEESSTEESESADDADTSDSADESLTQEPVSDENVKNADNTETSAFSYEEKIDNYLIKLSAEEGVIPEGTEVVITKQKSVAGKDTEDIANEVLAENEAVYDSVAFDISFMLDGTEIEPEEGKVNVTISLDDDLTESLSDVVEGAESLENTDNPDSSELQIIHIDDEANASVVEDVTVVDEGEETVVSYDADSFSVYEVAVVLSFDVYEPVVEINDVYKDIVNEDDFVALGDSIDPTANVKTLLAAPNKYENIYDMAIATRNAIKNRQPQVTLNYAIKGNVNQQILLARLSSTLVAHTGVPNEGDYIRWAYCASSTGGSNAYAGNCTYGTLIINFTYTHDAAQEVQTTNEINRLLNNEFKNVKNKSDYEKAKAVYDYIYKHIFYARDFQARELRGDYSRYSCYSAACEHNTVCEGYALLFYRLMLSLGVDARLIAGYGDGENHGWNIVQLGKYYYNVDTTWDSNLYEDGGKKSTYTPYFRFVGSSDPILTLTNGKKVSFDDQHVRWPQYSSESFNALYPTSTVSYKNSGGVVNATSIAINTNSATLAPGQTLQLSATLAPSNATKSVKFESTDPYVATVTASGLITAIADGTCDIIATSTYGGKKAICTVKVTDNTVYRVEGPSKITLRVNETRNCDVAIYPSSAAGSALKYKSSNKSIAKVDKYGNIKGKKTGKCTITVKSPDGKSSVKIKVVVKKQIHVKKVKLPKKLELSAGQTYTLAPTIKPSSATVKAVTWKSSKKKVAVIDSNGTITALKPGKTTITVITKDGKKKAKCKVIVR
ncbi:Ig-like domain-containing protein [Butyrivibrio sp. NC2002]|uniref:Ig-like domain-containing protein n=1 Tax=Butyrivibrio sp. NC2002 TaxID=1410610 RepID=UPI00068A347A|nr:Ig-like domain-containing protein [Butyrivibrio sp. NC2002]